MYCKKIVWVFKFQASPNIIRAIKSIRMNLVVVVARMGDMRNAYKM